MTTKAGFVAIIGAPNAGKSTLMNHLVGEKLAIVTPKVQTTRVNMRGILTHNDTQFVFVDTPGIHKPKAGRLLDESMVQAAWQAHDDADVGLVVVDAHAGFTDRVMEILSRLKKGRMPLYLALNKVDMVKKEKLLPMMAKVEEMDLFKGVFAISALKGSGVDDILTALEKHMPESPYLYDEDQVTDMPMRLIAGEMTRERAFMLLQDEVPYSLAVETVSYKHQEDGSVRIDQNLLVERDSQKGIVLGKGGAMIKKIGEQARKNLEAFLETRVHLFLKVKVNDRWANSTQFMREVGLEPAKKK